MRASSLGRRIWQMAGFGLLAGALLAVPLVLIGEKRPRDAALLGAALFTTLALWLDVPARARAMWRRWVPRRASASTVGRPAPVAARTGATSMPRLDTIVLRRTPARRYKPAARGRQVSAISALAARGRDAHAIARELRVPYDVVQFALQRRAA